MPLKYVLVIFLCAYLQPSWGEKIDYRLPDNVRPVHYDITIEPLFASGEFGVKVVICQEFKGEVIMRLQVLKPIKNITLHGDIDFHSIEASLIDSRNKKYEIRQIIYDAVKQFLIFVLSEDIPAGTSLTMSISYFGRMKEQPKGVHKYSYSHGKSVWRHIVLTVFEPTYARLGFPCFDEPGFKATFTVSIVRHWEYITLSNMPRRKSVDVSFVLIKDIYAQSLPMSTYSVAFAMLNFHNVSRGKQAVFATKEFIEEGRLDDSLNLAIDVLEAMEKHINGSSELRKLHHVVVPDATISMYDDTENWGLITYGESALLYDINVSTTEEEQYMVRTVCHEIAHQWFGNIVTPEWWDYVWLSEGFATYFEYFLPKLVRPSLNITKQFQTRVMHRALQVDGVNTSTPLTQAVSSPLEIHNHIGTIVSYKGAAVIRMLECSVSRKLFLRALKGYLFSNKFKTVQPEALWHSVQTKIQKKGSTVLQGLTISQIMDRWTKQKGYPIVSVSINYKNETVKLSQRSFDFSDHNKQIWYIPITYAMASRPSFSDTIPWCWFTREEEIYPIVVKETDWIIVNLEQTGYYRVNYDEANWNLIINQLNDSNFTLIPPANRAQLIDDAFSLARSRYISFHTLFNLLTYVKAESVYSPLIAFFNGISYWDKYLWRSPLYHLFQRFVRESLEAATNKVMLRLKLCNEPDKRLIQIKVLTWLCKMDDLTQQRMWHDNLRKEHICRPDVEEATFCGGMILDEDTEFKFEYLCRLYNRTYFVNWKNSRLASAFGCTRNITYIKKILKMAIDQEPNCYLKGEDMRHAFKGVFSSSNLGLEMAFDFLIKKFHLINDTEPAPKPDVLLLDISEYLTKQEHMDKFRTFVDKLDGHSKEKFGNTFKAVEKNINVNIFHANTYGNDILRWLKKYYDVQPLPSNSS